MFAAELLMPYQQWLQALPKGAPSVQAVEYMAQLFCTSFPATICTQHSHKALALRHGQATQVGQFAARLTQCQLFHASRQPNQCRRGRSGRLPRKCRPAGAMKQHAASPCHDLTTIRANILKPEPARRAGICEQQLPPNPRGSVCCQAVRAPSPSAIGPDDTISPQGAPALKHGRLNNPTAVESKDINVQPSLGQQVCLRQPQLVTGRPLMIAWRMQQQQAHA